ncbi:hypothetical protein T4B_4196 [Trichinella pseudospiralis]|uniref:Uncharacterized protein n=1 Tax=Trichinella pseudospiralis TaxID=6337 RepID=A0A0V1JZL6_TRIPS|nr:hypothetical protein T4B_4196 [Trichinella pseudospiralis]KRZ40410.1 hypothetical protein T4C_12315 [Trichinella pseudospiralis]
MSVRTMMRKYCNWTEISWTIRPDQLDPTTSYYSVSGGFPFLHRWRCNLRGKAILPTATLVRHFLAEIVISLNGGQPPDITASLK